MSTTFAALRTLHNLIGEALTDIERVFTDSEISSLGPSPPSSPSFTSQKPLDFPSLDDPFDPKSPAETLLSNPSVVRATKLLVASTGQLAAQVQRPFLTICDASMGVCCETIYAFPYIKLLISTISLPVCVFLRLLTSSRS
jgi:hypothetical protein